MTTLGQYIREAREAKRLTLHQLAKKVGLSAPFLSDLEHDRRATDQLQALATALDVPLFDLEARDPRKVNRSDLAGLEKRIEALEYAVNQLKWAREGLK